MATTAHLRGIKTPHYVSHTDLHSQSLSSQQRLELCGAGASKLPTPIRGRGLRVVCDARNNDVLVKTEAKIQGSEGSRNQLSCVMKFGGSSVASADRMKEVADLILSFPEESPVIVLSSMGKTTNKLIMAGEKAAAA